MTAAVAIVGAGPTGTSVLGRLCANASGLLPRRALDVHLVDPYPPGAGRVWRVGQPSQLMMNTPAADVTMFSDDSVRCAAPGTPGPSLAEWAGETGGYLPRSVMGGYLADVLARMLRSAPPDVRVVRHRASATDLCDAGGARQRVQLSTGRVLEVDAVVLAQGYTDVAPTEEERRLAESAARHRLTYLPSGYAGDLALGLVPAAGSVIVRGMGLTFHDVVTLLTVGRGGHFVRRHDGELTYCPSGREPVLIAGSRRGVPYHAQFAYRTGRRYPKPASLRVERLGETLLRAYYHDLFHATPRRTTWTWSAFESACVRAGWVDAEVGDLAAAAVPRRADRLDLGLLDRPLRGVEFGDRHGLRDWMLGYLRGDVRRRSDPANAADVALAYGAVWALQERGADAPWLERFVRYYLNGPPRQRLEELCALVRAGVVDFVGEDVAVGCGRTWRARSPTVPGAEVYARTLVEARLPDAALARTTDQLLRRLLSRGECTDRDGLLGIRLPDRRLLGRASAAHPRRFALGPRVVAGRMTTRLPQPRSNSTYLRAADALARAVLEEIVRSR